MRKLVLALGLIVLAQGSKCKDNDLVLPGNTFEITDATLATCKPYLSAEGDASGQDVHTCMVIANPNKRILRVFDLTENQFVLAPIGFFPLAVTVGAVPERVAALPEVSDSWAFVLDPAKSRIFSVATIGQGGQPSFVSRPKEEGIETAFSPRRMVLVKGEKESLWAFIAFKEAQIQVIPLDPKSGKALDVGFLFALPIPTVGDVDDIVVDADYKNIIVTGAGFGLALLPIAKIIAAKGFPAEPLMIIGVDGDIKHVVTGKSALEGSNAENIALVLVHTPDSEGKDQYRAVLYGLDRVTEQKIGSVRLDSPPVAAYIPAGSPATCCNGELTWASVLTAAGDLHYLKLKKIKKNDKDNLDNKDAIGATLNIAEKSGLGSRSVAGGVKILGGAYINPKRDQPIAVDDKQNCNRKMFLIFSGFIGSICEGDAEKVIRVDLR